MVPWVVARRSLLTHGRTGISRDLPKLPLQVCKSAAGFYVGTREENGEPFSRESQEYWPTRQKAERALTLRIWSQRRAP
jgi:hypothetical protein